MPTPTPNVGVTRSGGTYPETGSPAVVLVPRSEHDQLPTATSRTAVLPAVPDPGVITPLLVMTLPGSPRLTIRAVRRPTRAARVGAATAAAAR